MWSCFRESQVAEPLFTSSEQYLPLRELRRQIMFDMEPGLSHVDNEVGLALQRLHYLVSWPLSARHSLSTLNDYHHDELCCQSPLGEDAFVELAEFVTAQRSYTLGLLLKLFSYRNTANQNQLLYLYMSPWDVNLTSGETDVLSIIAINYP